jgi:uncharacterized protein YjeT (DUF2065 family)
MAATPAGARPRASTDLVGLALGAAGVSLLVPGLLAFFAPGAFYDLLAPFPPQNDHIMRDVGSWQIALGLAAAVAVKRRSWRVPMLAIVTLQLGLHAISHLIDIGNSDPSWVGPAEFVALAVGTLALAGLLAREHRA